MHAHVCSTAAFPNEKQAERIGSNFIEVFYPWNGSAVADSAEHCCMRCRVAMQILNCSQRVLIWKLQIQNSLCRVACPTDKAEIKDTEELLNTTIPPVSSRECMEKINPSEKWMRELSLAPADYRFIYSNC